MRDILRALTRTRGRRAALAVVLVTALAVIALPARAQSNPVTIQNFAFGPPTLQVPVGATVVWTNKDSVTHTVTSDNGTFDSGNLAQNASFSLTFNQAGTFTYHCKIHPFMTAQIVVGSAAATSTSAPAATATSTVLATPTAIETATTAPAATTTSTSVATSTPTAVPTSGGPGGATPVIQVAHNPTLGAILVNGAGMTLYTLSSEAGGVLKCTGGCLTVWPPVTLPAGVTAPTLGPGVTGAVGTIQRPDGSVQVTYQGLPLYQFVKDKAPGDTNGNGIVAFGGTWRAAAVQSVPLSATPVDVLTIRISRLSGAPAGKVRATFRIGPAQERDVCTETSCRLSVPRGDSVTLKAFHGHGTFAGWKVAGVPAVVHSSTTHLSIQSSVRVTALFRAR